MQKYMPTLVERAKNGEITPPMRSVAQVERTDPVHIRKHVAEGSIVIMQRKKRSTVIGSGLSTKINVNLGTSTGKISPDDEIKNTRIAEKYGADTISNLSMGGDIGAIRAAVLASTILPVTTVKVYPVAAETGRKDLTAGDIIDMLGIQACRGISSGVVHCVSHAMLRELKKR